MRWPIAQRNLVVYSTLFVCALAICGWQVEEHLRFRRNAAEALINRGRDITSTLGVVIRAQRRVGAVVWKERLQSALQDLVRPEDLQSIAVLGATGETIARAGDPVDLTPDVLRSRGVFWHDRYVTIMNVMDLGATTTEDGAAQPAAIVVTDERTARAFRPPPIARRGLASAASADGKAGPPGAAAPRPIFSRPSWMTKEEFDSVIQKQGVHSLVLSLSTDTMHQAVRSDWLLRSLVCLFASVGAVISGLAWRNLTANADLQIRLVKAGEMNTHLKEMNLAAAGLAHETRNPLNLIRGLAQMIAMAAGDVPKLKEHASIILEETDRVTAQLNEFINYSKPRPAHLAPVQVAHLVADVARTLLPDVEEKHIELRQPDSTLHIEADEQLLRQALFNVLLNATQAVGPGGRIEVWLAPAGPREALLEIRDDGPGVPAAERVSIFKPYVTMRPKGVGLGLAIVAQIAAVHHWEVTCHANEPHGAVFRFSHLKISSPVA